MSRTSLLAVAMLATACGTQPDTRPETADYIIEAILVPYCGRAGCHSSDARAHNLAFDTIPDALAAMQTTQRGMPMVVPGNSGGSRLYRVLIDSNRIMPPDMPLTDADIDLIKRWIDDGAAGYP